ncbi:MAG: beta-L-arabinofuranosidase domain-containing protein [Verrucomicrobiota bacterium]
MKKQISFKSVVAAISLFLFAARGFCLSAAYEPLPLGAIKPKGWIYTQITNDAVSGMAGNFQKFRPVCGSGTWVNKDGSDGAAEMAGNWLDGYVRMAYLTDVDSAKKKADAFVADVLKAQEPDGYLGNYPASDRFKRKGRELFNESRINYALLAYYELTGNKKVLDAVIKSVKLTMSKYTPANKPFTFVPGDAGFDPNKKLVAEDNVDDGKPTPDKAHSINGHVLMFVDVCEWLYRLTSDRAYATYAAFLYDEYSRSPDIHPDEIKVANLLNPAAPYEGHGAHIAEHLRVPLFLAYADGSEPYPQAARGAYEKLLRYIVPSGAMASDEGVHNFSPVPTQGYEYCTTTELATSLESATEKTGSMKYADMIERLVFNAGQGARTADGKMIAYLSVSTLLAAVEDLKLGKNHNSNGRWQYSPAHQVGGSCCSANAVKLMPHYVSSMWMKTAGDGGLAALLFGPSLVSTTVKGVAVTIEEETSYPFSDAIAFRITAASPVSFPLRLRVPAWAGAVTVVADGATVETVPDLRVLTKTWQTGDTVTVTFQNPITPTKCANGEIALNRGPLLYVLPWPWKKTVLKKSRDGVPEYIEWDVRPLSAKTTSGYYLERTAPEAAFRAQSNRLYDRNFPWAQPSLILTGSMRTDKNNSNSRKPVTLFPLGSTMLRFASFPQSN